ncbi:hypothetical protein NDU88_007562, partial [Pleurodeles waltl]
LIRYELKYGMLINLMPLAQYKYIMYNDGSAQPAVGTNNYTLGLACNVEMEVMKDVEFHLQQTCMQSLGDCTAQLVDLQVLILALEHMDPEFLTLIVCDSCYCV